MNKINTIMVIYKNIKSIKTNRIDLLKAKTLYNLKRLKTLKFQNVKYIINKIHQKESLEFNEIKNNKHYVFKLLSAKIDKPKRID